MTMYTGTDSFQDMYSNQTEHTTGVIIHNTVKLTHTNNVLP